MKKHQLITIGSLFLAFAATAAANDEPVYKNPQSSVDERVKDLLGRMTLEEKISYCSGVREQYIRDIPRLGLPAINMQDGPIGVHGGGTTFPPGIALAATFDPELLYQVGQALGRDSRGIGVHVTLGPAMNIVRSPILGRAAEYYGEDPYLTARLVPSLINGVQSQGVMASAKHFIGNEFELIRTGSDSIIDERTLREIYLPPFEAAVKSGNVATIMGAYNHVNGAHACVNPHTLKEILRDEWGFQGIILSDWGAGGGPAITWAMGPLDVAMPSGAMGNPSVVMPLIKEGKIDPAVYDQKVSHILHKIIEFGFLDRPQKDSSFAVRSPAALATALQISREATVLLKNKGNLLPLSPPTIRSVAVIGPGAEVGKDSTPYPTGIAGSSFNECPNTVSVAQALQQLSGDKMKIVVVPDYLSGLYNTTNYFHKGADGKLEPGLQASYFKNADFSGKPDLERVDKDLSFNHGWRNKGWLKELRPFKKLSVRWTGSIKPAKTGLYRFVKESNLGMKVWLDGKMIIDDLSKFDTDHWVYPTGGVVQKLEGGRSHDLKIEYTNRPEVAHMFGVRFGWGPAEPTAELEAARSCDAVVACYGYGFMTEGEGFDRTWELPYSQAEILEKVSKANPRTIVVLNGGGACQTESWIGQVPALIQAWYYADAGAQAVAEILLGKVNPSGKLPISFAKRWEDNPSSPYFKADWSKGSKPINYTEGIFVGYRGFDQAGVEPLFPFGHGLSYTTFGYANLALHLGEPGKEKDFLTVTCDLTNTGSQDGTEVVQLYVGDDHAPVARPAKELKGFQRVSLKPGETKSVSFVLTPRDLSYYDVTQKAWILSPGKFTISVGSSSRDLPLKEVIEVGKVNDK